MLTPPLPAPLGSALKRLDAQTIARAAALFVAAIAAACLLLAPFVGSSVSAHIWGVEPLTYIGAVLLIIGLAALALSYAAPQILRRKRPPDADGAGMTMQDWSGITQQYFELFDHDLGRPLRRILGKEREVRAFLRASNGDGAGGEEVAELLDEIEMQAPNFRLMMSNIRVLIQLEAPDPSYEPQPVEASAVVRRIVERYIPVASDSRKSITWWADPEDFGIVYSDSAAIEHIVANLIDNAVRFAETQVEVSLSRGGGEFFVRVWDDGPGVSEIYERHIFDRGWTPAVARREEKTSSGLGLFIASTLAARYGGSLAVDRSENANGNGNGNGVDSADGNDNDNGNGGNGGNANASNGNGANANASEQTAFLLTLPANDDAAAT